MDQEGESLHPSEMEYESEQQSQMSNVEAAFPLEELDSQEEVFVYLRSVRQETNNALAQCKMKKQVPNQQAQENSKQIIPQPTCIQISQHQQHWERQVIQHFGVIKANISFLQKTQKGKSQTPNLKQIFSNPPEIYKLYNLEYKQIIKLIESISTHHSKNLNWESNSYNACLWLYSLLALFRVSGGVKYHEITSEVNFICKRDSSDAAKVLRTVMIHEFGQIHIR